ncbi:hypothetical protein M1709_23495, partial [Salmonella enterica subsp. enterica serovar Carrau]|uniref:hypothetical protein n=1 Tax=Salmonella enterica TaxID=28901 RepID=UPI0021B23876
DLTIVPSVNATVPGAVTVTTPAQDAVGNVAATLTYVDTSGKLLSKEARAGTTTIAVGKAVMQTVDTRFYPQVHICLVNLLANEFVVPGQTEVKLCDGSGHSIADGSGYSVTTTQLSQAACTALGGGVCPPDKAGAKADFTNLTGDDIISMLTSPVTFRIGDTVAGTSTSSGFPPASMAFFGELIHHFGPKNMGAPDFDLFHHFDAVAFCKSTLGKRAYNRDDYAASLAAEVLTGNGQSSGGQVTGRTVSGAYTGPITAIVKTGGDTNPEIFVDGIGSGTSRNGHRQEQQSSTPDGAYFPGALVFVNGHRAAATSWTMNRDDIDESTDSFGAYLHSKTNWNLSDAYFVNNWPGTPYTAHKGNGDTNYPYVTQVNYITGYICAASLH